MSNFFSVVKGQREAKVGKRDESLCWLLGTSARKASLSRLIDPTAVSCPAGLCCVFQSGTATSRDPAAGSRRRSSFCSARSAWELHYRGSGFGWTTPQVPKSGLSASRGKPSYLKRLSSTYLCVFELPPSRLPLKERMNCVSSCIHGWRHTKCSCIPSRVHATASRNCRNEKQKHPFLERISHVASTGTLF